MGRAVLQACLPWLGLLAVSVLAAYLLLRLSGGRANLRRLWRLHHDETGAVQTLSFILVLPFFVMLILFIVQVSQLTIGTIVVEYAAFAAARSAVVWIPADMPPPESANCISAYGPDDPDQRLPVRDPDSPDYGPSDGGVTYLIKPGSMTGSMKHNQITAAAVLACMPIAPSRDLGIELPGQMPVVADALQRAYSGVAPRSAGVPRVPARLQNKLAYALENTKVEVRFYHKNAEPPLLTQFIPPDIEEFRLNELGWQDQVTVTVQHDFALLPGPGRFLAYFTPGPSGSDSVSARIRPPRAYPKGTVYVCPLQATATMPLEGEKSVVPYAYYAY